MSSPRFKQAFFCDMRPPLTLEDAIRTCGCMAGVHLFDFTDTLDEDFDDFSSWTGDLAATWNVGAGDLVMTGGGAARWYQARYGAQIAPGFVASFDLTTGSGAFVFHGKTDETSKDGFIAWWTNAACGFATVDAAGAQTLLLSMPYGINAPARVQIAVSWRLNSVDEDRKWLQMSMFADGEEMCAYAVDIGGGAWDYAFDYVGFAVYQANVCTVDNLTVQELHRIANYLTVDPSETPAQGMQRAIGTTRLKMQARYNGTIRVWRPGDRVLDWTVPSSPQRAVEVQDRKDQRRALTHVRTIGVLHQVDRFEDDEGQVHMHRFTRTDDPNLFSEEEVYTEAGKVLHEAQELQRQVILTMPGMPLLEAHDRIEYEGEDWRVDSIQGQLAHAGLATVYRQRLQMRRYLPE